MDKEYWNPDWKERPKNVWKEKVESLSQQEKWIIDGNYIGSMGIRIQHADLIVFLDVNKYRCLYQAMKRTIKGKKRHRSDMAEGCKERFDFNFYKFIWRFDKTTKPKILKLIEDYHETTCIIIRNKNDIEKLWTLLEV